MKKLAFILFVLFSVTIFSCTPYEDGPKISLRKPEKRLENSWNYNQVYRNGLEVTQGQVPGSINYRNSSIGFDDNGNFSAIFSINNNPEYFDGIWRFNGEKDSLHLEYDFFPQMNESFKITRLKNDELWLQQEVNSNSFEYRLIP